MSSRQVLEPKHVSEIISLVFDFASQLAVGETISSASTSSTVYSGTDPYASSVVTGSATISGTQVTQKVHDGAAGVTYLIACTAVTSTGETLTISGYLVVLPDTL